MMGHFSISALLLEATPDTRNVQFFTLETLFTAAGETTAIFTITSVLHGFIPKLSPRFFALALSFLFTFVGISLQGQPWNPSNVFLAIINGFIVYAAAVGINNVSTPPSPGIGRRAGAPIEPAAVHSYRWWA